MTFSRRGAVDLSGLGQSGLPHQSASPGSAPAGGSYVVDVSEENFQDVVQSSLGHLVVVALWSPRSPQGAEYNDQVAAVVNSYGGKILLARVDVDQYGQIAQAFGVQGVPTLVGLVKGQPVPLMQGPVDDAQLRQVFDELITIAVQNGVAGRAQPTAVAEGDTGVGEEEPFEDPRFAAADEAFGAGDLDTAVAEYEKLKAQYPADGEVAERLAGVRLLARTQSADLNDARRAAADAPDDVAAQLLVADLDVSGGHIDDAFDRLITLVKRLSGDERDQVRERLIELFTVVGAGDPRVATARRALAAALY